MPCPRLTSPRRRRGLAFLAALAALASGCGGGAHAPARSAPLSRLAFGASAARLAEDREVQAAAHVFAGSYLRSTNEPRRPVTHDASAALAVGLRANAARLRGDTGLPPLRLRGIAVSITGADHARATMTLGAGAGPTYPITFLLRRRNGRWLAVGINGTGAAR